MTKHQNIYTNIVVLGGGESGTGAALLAARKGYKVFVSEYAQIKPEFKKILSENGIAFEEGGHSAEIVSKAGLVIKSPGISDRAPILQEVAGADIISEIEFASWFTKAKIIGITGSNGKTTTTLLTGHIMKKAGLDVCVAGNVGTSFAANLAHSDHDYFVLELSSFQLDGIVHFRPDIAIITNITPDHLDRYDYSFEAYAKSKSRICMNQTADDTLIYCADDAASVEILGSLNTHPRRIALGSTPTTASTGGYFSDNQLFFNINPNPFTMTIEELALQGRHNMYNTLAAGLTAKIIGIRNETIKQSMSDYQNVAHRLEYVANVHGVSFYNDSKATNVNSTWYALEYFNRPIIWIAGGVDKGNDYSKLVPLVRQKVKAIVCLGTDNQKLHEVFEGKVETIVNTDSAEQAVGVAALLAAKNDIVLLSPACASFDLFENYEDRGNQFKMAVKSL